MQIKSKGRNYSLDLVKLIAMVCVAGLHNSKLYGQWVLSDIIYKSCVVAIPLFFMSSGFVLIGKDGGLKYSITKILNILRFVSIVCSAIYIVNVLVGKHNLSFSEGITQIYGSVLGYGSMGIFWYLGSMILIYLCLPFLDIAYKHKQLFYIIIVLVVR